MTSLFLGKAVFGATIILINLNNGLLVPEPKTGRLSWEPWKHCGGSMVKKKSFLTAGVICRTMFIKNTGQDERDDLRCILQAEYPLLYLNCDTRKVIYRDNCL